VSTRQVNDGAILDALNREESGSTVNKVAKVVPDTQPFSDSFVLLPIFAIVRVHLRRLTARIG
jgi:hypothetical protein